LAIGERLALGDVEILSGNVELAMGHVVLLSGSNSVRIGTVE